MLNEENKPDDQPAIDEALDISDESGEQSQQEPGADGDDPSMPAEASQGNPADIGGAETASATEAALRNEDSGDAVAIPNQPPDTGKAAAKSGPIDWSQETSAHAIELELKRVETEVRSALDAVDSKRKRRLGGTQRWRELEQDILSWRFTGRFSEEAAQHLNQLIRRRHFLYERLRFVATTRPTWNT